MKTSSWILPLAAALIVGCASEPPAPPPPEVPPPSPPTIVEETPYEAPPAEAPAETPVRPEQSDAGKWRVSVISVHKAEQTEEMVKRLQADGLRVETEAADVGGTGWQRVILPGLRRFADARQMVAYVQHTYGASQAWVLPREGAAPAAAEPAEPESTPPEQPAN